MQVHIVHSTNFLKLSFLLLGKYFQSHYQNIAQIMCLIGVLIFEKSDKKLGCQLKATKIWIFHIDYCCSRFLLIFNLQREETVFSCSLQEQIHKISNSNNFIHYPPLVLFGK